MEFIAGEDLRVGQAAELNVEDGKMYCYHPLHATKVVILIVDAVKKGETIILTKSKNHWR